MEAHDFLRIFVLLLLLYPPRGTVGQSGARHQQRNLM